MIAIDLRPWELWFAWYPVTTECGSAFFRTIRRRVRWSTNTWEYREL